MDSRHPERVPGFPSCCLFALLDTDADLRGALLAVAPYVDPGAVRVLTGDEGVRALDVSGGARGLRGRRLLGVLHELAHGRDGLQTHDGHLRRGGHLLLIPTREWAHCQQLVRALAQWHAHGLVRYARYSVVDVTPRYCVATDRALTSV